DETGKGIIFLNDNPSEAAKKIMSATTDSIGRVTLDYDKQPGVSNLLQILALLSGEDVQKVAHEYDGKTSYGELKKDVAAAVTSFLTDFQSTLKNVDEAQLEAKLLHSEKAMN